MLIRLHEPYYSSLTDLINDAIPIAKSLGHGVVVFNEDTQRDVEVYPDDNTASVCRYNGISLEEN